MMDGIPEVQQGSSTSIVLFFTATMDVENIPGTTEPSH
jgi:hypothetical protein